MPATQEAKQTLETIVKNHTDINIEQRIENNCRFDTSATNSITAEGSTGAVINGVVMNTDLTGYCETNNYMATLANIDFTTELKNELKTTLKQEGFNVASDQDTNQNIKNKLINLIETDTLQETLNDCTTDLLLTNSLNLDNSTNATVSGLEMTHNAMVNCLFNTESQGTTQASTDNTVDNSMDASLEQIGLFASGGSFLSIIMVIAVVALLMFGRGKKGSKNA